MTASRSLTCLLAILLLLGTAFLGAGSAVHPVLAGDAARDLPLMASTAHWRMMHLLMLTGSGLVIAGIWVRVLDGQSSELSTHRTRVAVPLAAALGVVALGETLNALNIAYMAGAGTHLAAVYAAGRAEAGPLFDATHSIGLMFARFGNFLIALGALMLGFLERADGSRPSWIAWLAWIAAVGGFLGVAFFQESSRGILAAVAILSGWQVATAVLALVHIKRGGA